MSDPDFKEVMVLISERDSYKEEAQKIRDSLNTISDIAEDAVAEVGTLEIRVERRGTIIAISLTAAGILALTTLGGIFLW